MTRRSACLTLLVTLVALIPSASRAMAQSTTPATAPAAAAPPSQGLTFSAPVPTTPEMKLADVEKVMALRSLGDAKAPVKLTEFASLSCPHCAEFYKDTFPKLKAAYIDKGKVQYTYIDFPLNAPALDAAAVALCVPEESYFKFIDYLFQTQQQWVFSEHPDQTLLQNGKLLGADGDKLQRCLNSKSLKAALVARMQKEGQEFNVDATPSFVINGDKASKVSGALDFETLSKMIDQRLEANKSAAKK